MARSPGRVDSVSSGPGEWLEERTHRPGPRSGWPLSDGRTKHHSCVLPDRQLCGCFFCRLLSPPLKPAALTLLKTQLPTPLLVCNGF